MKGPEHRDEIWLSRRIERTQPAPDGPERLKTADHTRCQVAVSVREGTIFYTKIIDMIVPSSVLSRRIERTQPAPDGPERLKTADHTRCQVAVSVREGTIFYTKIIDMIVPSSVKPRG